MFQPGEIVNRIKVLYKIGFDNKRGQTLYQVRCLKCSNTFVKSHANLKQNANIGCDKCKRIKNMDLYIDVYEYKMANPEVSDAFMQSKFGITYMQYYTIIHFQRDMYVKGKQNVNR